MESFANFYGPIEHSTTMDTVMKDPEFLVRCALTYNWDILLQFCDVLVEIFESSTRDRDCYHHSQRIHAATQQLRQQDQWGNTALHAACYNHPPLRVITSLLNCAAMSSSSSSSYYNYNNSPTTTNGHPPLHLMKTRDESTPLSIACATGASIHVLHALLDPPQELLGGGSFSSSSSSGGLAVRIPDSRGCTPLSELAIHYELQRKSPLYARSKPLPLDQVQLILTDSILINSSSTTAGMEYPSTSTLHSTLSQGNTYNRNHTSTTTSDETQLFELFWAKVELLIRSAWCCTNEATSTTTTTTTTNNNNNNNHQYYYSSSSWISILHGLAHICDSCPPVITKLICRCYPAMISFANRNQMLPLHYAILNASSLPYTNNNTTTTTATSPFSIQKYNEYCKKAQQQQQQQQEQISFSFPQHDKFLSSFSRLQYSIMAYRRAVCIETLVTMYPNSVKQCPFPSHSNSYGKERSIFCQAIASRLYWSLDTVPFHEPSYRQEQQRQANQDDHHHNDNNNDSTTIGPLHLLWKHHPEAASIPDSCTGFYPFLLAAIATPEQQLSMTRQQETYKLLKSYNFKFFSQEKQNFLEDEYDCQEGRLQLDTIYSLLRLYPQVLTELL